ncbi:MAG: hypothetical protein ACOYOQ_09005 [Microthrixaceae bacterium]
MTSEPRPAVGIGRIKVADGTWRPAEFTVTGHGLGWRGVDQSIAATTWIRHSDVRNLDEVDDPTAGEVAYEVTGADGTRTCFVVESRFIQAYVAFLQVTPAVGSGVDAAPPPDGTPWWRTRTGALVGAAVVVALVASILTWRAVRSGGDETATVSAEAGSSSAETTAKRPATTAGTVPSSTQSVTTVPPATQPPVTVAPPPPPTVTTTTTIPLITVSGGISFLKTVGFDGVIDGASDIDFRPSPNGTSCSGSKGYGDLNPGATVIIADGSGAVVATVPLGAGAIVNGVRGTPNERSERERLIDSIYGLRVAYAQYDSLRVAELNYERAQLRVNELNLPFPQPFEGLPFYASWCRLSFSAPGLVLSPSYTVTIGTRGSTTTSADELFANGGSIELTVA